MLGGQYGIEDIWSILRRSHQANTAFTTPTTCCEP